MLVRRETNADIAAIYSLTKTAFEPMAFSDGSEPEIINALRADGDLTLSLVVENDGDALGHAAFSAVSIGGKNGGWFALGPISVDPKHQRKGLGKSLIQHGFEILKSDGALGCVVVGNPDIYSRVGFSNQGGLTYGDLPPKLIRWVSFGDVTPQGELVFAPAFDLDKSD